MPQFNNDAIKRIQNAVKAIERKSDRARNPVVPLGVSNFPFIAVLTSSYSSGYAWNYVQITESPALVGQSSWGSSDEMGLAYHLYNCQQLQSGEYVYMLAYNLFQCIDLSPRRVMTSSSISAGAGNGSTYGTGTVSGYGTIRNYYSNTIDSGKMIYITMDHATGVFQTLTEDCD